MKRTIAISAIFKMVLKGSLVILFVGCGSSQVSIGEQNADGSVGGAQGGVDAPVISGGATSSSSSVSWGGSNKVGGASAVGGNRGSAGEPWIQATRGGNDAGASALGGSALLGGSKTSGSSGVGGSTAPRCGGIAGFKCPSGQFCDYGACQIPFPDAMGTCMTLWEVCPANFDPVCGCDGLTYSNDCVRQGAGVSKRSEGECAKADGGVSEVALSEAALCAATGGAVKTQSCCTTIGDFPNTCLVGACSCGPTSSHNISVCNCPSGCFVPGIGCFKCTLGADQTCNNDPRISSLHGQCLASGRCECNTGYLQLDNGKCE